NTLSARSVRTRLWFRPSLARLAVWTKNQKPRPKRRHMTRFARPGDISLFAILRFIHFGPKLIGSSLFCITGATWLREPRFRSRECLCNGLGRSENLVMEFIGFSKPHLASSARHWSRALVPRQRRTCSAKRFEDS